jgi:hypothetical protein
MSKVNDNLPYEEQEEMLGNNLFTDAWRRYDHCTHAENK